MAKKGMKVKELARELNVTSRVLIDRCRENGLSVQNSITKIDDRTADRIRAWFTNQDSPVDNRDANPSEG